MGSQHPSVVTPFGKRAETAAHPLTAYLLRLMELKSSNLCLSADVTTARELLQLADRTGPSIVVLKTHYDILSGWDYNVHTGTGVQLAALARKHGFLLFEDRKFADIGKTAQQQYTAGTARIIEWAHLVTVNMDAGPAAVTALSDAATRWHERIHFGVKTSVSVGTPTAEGYVDEDGEEDEKDKAGELPWAKSSSATAEAVSPGSGDSLPAPTVGGTEGRKGSIVSITTVTQHFEPAESPRGGGSFSGPAGGSGAGAGDESGSGSGSHHALPAQPTNNAAAAGEALAGIEEAPLERGILLLAQMSSQGNFMTPAYTQACVDVGRAHRRFVVGFIAQQSLNALPDDTFVHLTPGCKLPPAEEDPEDDGETGHIAGDGLGQQYNTPAKLVGTCGSDIVIVGRGIIAAYDPPAEAERYRRKAWRAYQARLQG